MVTQRTLNPLFLVRVQAGQCFDSAFGLAQHKSRKAEEKHPERTSEASESKDTN